MADHTTETVLKRCNELAMRSLGRTATNPNVGAIVWNRSTHHIQGEGWHRSFGGPHAEVNAIEKAIQHNSVKGHTIAVSLEPCNHAGKTPPCTTAIRQHQLSEVLVDQVDPNPRMGGQSIQLLERSGLRVSPPENTAMGRSVIHPFRIGMQFQRPFIRLKMAVSSDGFMGRTGERIKISNAISDRWVHRIRNETQAIMVGTSTVLNDNPSLTSRYGNRHNPIRVIPDRHGILPNDLKVFAPTGKVIVCTINSRTDYPAKILRVDPYDLRSTFRMLYSHLDIGSILVEGGSKLASSLINEGIWDELIVIENTQLELKKGVKMPDFPATKLRHKIKFGSDTINFIINPVSR